MAKAWLVSGIDYESNFGSRVTEEPKTPIFKFNEDMYLREIDEYVRSTYKAHYAGKGVQAFELIHSAGNGQGFTMGSIIKYATRYGRKEGASRKDLLKIIHFALLQLWVLDQGEIR